MKFYKCDHIMEMMDISRATAYNLIRTLNDELAKKGYLTKSGRIPVRYFHERTYTEDK